MKAGGAKVAAAGPSHAGNQYECIKSVEPEDPRVLRSDEGKVDVRSRPTAMKRARERARVEKQKEKAARRMARAQQAEDRTGSEPGVDPDIAHIRAGPQAKQDWQIDGEEAEE